MRADVIVDLQYGDCGKGKVTHHLLKDSKYTHCMRFNGGANAGHTIHHNGKEFITHQIPAGIFYGVTSIIGPGCALNVEQFFKELDEIKQGGLKIPAGLIKIADNVHIVTDDHIEEDRKEDKIGSTKRGNMPAYRAKYGRTGVRAESIPELKPYLIDIYKELFPNTGSTNVLLEGAQGFYLDPDWGEYPYVTSSHCTVAAAIQNGVPHNCIKEVYGVCKPYETYVGARKFQPEGDIFNEIRDAGKEYGATTGRPRQVNWMNVDKLVKAAKLNGVTKIIFNKMDVLQKVDRWTLRRGRELWTADNEEVFRMILSSYFTDIDITYSYQPDKI